MFYGGNDGVLRAVNGNRGTDQRRIGSVAGRATRCGPSCRPSSSRTSSGCGTTREPIQFLRQHLPRLRSRSPTASTGRSPRTGRRQHLWLFASVRRGGRDDLCLRRLDDQQHPASPTALEEGLPQRRRRHGLHAGFEEIGQTWSCAQDRSRPGSPSCHADRGRRIRSLRGADPRRLPGPLRHRPRATGSTCSMPTPAPS